ncbi:hypothetical protein, partial [Dysgonomonas macrotermitis]
LSFALVTGVSACYGVQAKSKEKPRKEISKPNRFEAQFHKADSVFTSKYLKGNYKIIIIRCD